jgi:hypothetical protein
VQLPFQKQICLCSHFVSLFLLSLDDQNGDKLKKAQVTPLYKKNDSLLKTNYRPVSVLCIFSKIFEKILERQLSDFFENIFNPYLCAFGRGLKKEYRISGHTIGRKFIQ